MRYEGGMKNVVLGASGQLGRALCRVLPGELVGLDRATADLTAPIMLRQTLESIRPRFVLNAAGFTQVDRAEVEPDQAFAVNAFALRNLAAICHELNAVLIHFSTNYVFGLDRMRDAPYDEDDPPGPVNVYGASKLAGEYFVRERCPRHFIVRTCGLYGQRDEKKEHLSFVDAMLRNAGAGGSVRVVDDQICTPTSAADLALAVIELFNSDAFGVYHLTNAGACTWHEFAEAIFAIRGQAVEVEAIQSASYPVPAKRPRFSVLSNHRWINTGFTGLRHWRESLEQHLSGR